MAKLKIFLPLFVLVLLLAACGEEKDQDNHDGHNENNEPSMEALEVKLEGPEEVKQGESVTFSAMVTQGEEKVSDADEVMFEIWKEGAKKDSMMMKAESDGEGKYSVKTTFEEDGNYIVQSHVTARSMHTMPKQQVTVTKSE
ncbi:FixH family protein [Pseudalkalibacillus berkeleyi]|uniref:FixH family protein n=1 Tax=Pseudalkalibacillus berkeleyi TaxID=1069813 RepID=A0ABS9GUP2_9BACL|nr:FixH family protein [Pseudalkalibacillus berkeleyi]MCF6136562.1 FixH family protein [Pseudalkalibacillus berkeleyi]